jgi:heme exporter protein D
MGNTAHSVFLALTLTLIPLTWLVVTALAVAACRSASRADRVASRRHTGTPDRVV